MANSRFKNLGGGLFSETIATTTQIEYNPTTQGASVNFIGKPFIKPGDDYLSVGGDQNNLFVDLTPLALTCPVPVGVGFLDPVTGTDLGKVSYMGLIGMIKYIYDDKHNARALAAATPVLPPDANRQADVEPPADWD